VRKLRPYGRAKLIRKLELRSRLQALGIYDGAAMPRPDLESETRASAVAPESAANSTSADSEAPLDTFSESVLKRIPSEANLRRAYKQLQDIKGRIERGLFKFEEEFPDYRYQGCKN
jgi:hypothetical protein